MTPHPEDAMTQEAVRWEWRYVDPALRISAEWIPIVADFGAKVEDVINAFCADPKIELRPLYPASAQQEPAPSADAEEVMKFATKVACDWGHSQCAPVVADAIRKDRALRRYAGDGVTDEMVEAGKRAAHEWAKTERVGPIRDLQSGFVRAIIAAALIKPGEKGGAR